MSTSTKHQAAAFARPDVLAIVLTMLCLALLAGSLGAGNRSSTSAARCIGNFRELTVAWQAYADDNTGRLVENYDGADAQGGAITGSSASAAPWACGWENWVSSNPDNTNALFIRNAKWARLGPYYRSAANIHKCPADTYVSFAQRSRGWTQRVRTVSMNATMGLPRAKGPFDPLYKLARNVSDLAFPGPAESSLFIDEHPDSANDPLFWPPFGTAWEDLPGNFHNGGATFSFADGHVEVHQWRTINTTPVLYSSSAQVGQTDAAEIHWMSYHSQRVSEKSH